MAQKAIPLLLGLLVFILIAPFHFVRSLWSRVTFKQDTLVSFIEIVYAKVLTTTEEALALFMPEASVTEERKALTPEQLTWVSEKSKVSLDPYYDSEFQFFVGRKNHEIVGYAVRDAVPGKWGLIEYMLAIRPDGSVQDVLVLEYQEKRGKPVAKKRFLKQFRGKTIKNKIKVMKDIRGVTGASISSNGMADGIRKMLHVFQVVYGDRYGKE